MLQRKSVFGALVSAPMFALFFSVSLQAQAGLTCDEAIPVTVPADGSNVAEFGMIMPDMMPMMLPSCASEEEPPMEEPMGGYLPVVDVSDCVDPMVRVMWYEVEGTGSTLRIRTCNGTTNFDTQLWVFRGTCEEPICVAYNDDETCGTASRLDLCTIPGETYKIAVGGACEETGEFRLRIRDLLDECAPVPLGLTCADALPLELLPDGENNDFLGTLTPGLPPAELPPRAMMEMEPEDVTALLVGDEDPPMVGMWFTVEGNGAWLRARTCGPDSVTNFDTMLWVFCGPCEDLTCVAFNDDGGCNAASNEIESQVEWCSVDGAVYRIFVAGKNGETGDFRLRLKEQAETCPEPPVECCPEAALEMIGAPCPATLMGSMPELGSMGMLSITDANPMAVGFLYMFDAMNAETPMPVLGCDTFGSPSNVIGMFVTDADGAATMEVPIPEDTSLCGAQAILQACTLAEGSAPPMIVGSMEMPTGPTPAITNGLLLTVGITTAVPLPPTEEPIDEN